MIPFLNYRVLFSLKLRWIFFQDKGKKTILFLFSNLSIGFQAKYPIFYFIISNIAFNFSFSEGCYKTVGIKLLKFFRALAFLF